MLHIKLKGMELRARCNSTYVLTHILNMWVGLKGKTNVAYQIKGKEV